MHLEALNFERVQMNFELLYCMFCDLKYLILDDLCFMLNFLWLLISQESITDGLSLIIPLFESFSGPLK